MRDGEIRAILRRNRVEIGIDDDRSLLQIGLDLGHITLKHRELIPYEDLGEGGRLVPSGARMTMVEDGMLVQIYEETDTEEGSEILKRYRSVQREANRRFVNGEKSPYMGQ